jgi:hypothetical protein
MICRRTDTGLTSRIGKALALRNQSIDMTQLGGDLLRGESLCRRLRT